MIGLLDAAISGTGIYSIPEAARYAKMKPSSLRNWFAGGTDRAPIRESVIDSPDFKAITFLDLVEAVAIRTFRADHNVSFQRIRQAIITAKEKYGIDNPFAHEHHKTVLVGHDLHIRFGDDVNALVQISGKNIGQKTFRTCIEAYMKDLKFDANGIANLYTPYAYRNQEIIMTPRMHFGEPVVYENGYTAKTLYKAAIAEGSIERAAHIYDVTPESVEAAYRYFSQELALAA